MPVPLRPTESPPPANQVPQPARPWSSAAAGSRRLAWPQLIVGTGLLVATVTGAAATWSEIRKAPDGSAIDATGANAASAPGPSDAGESESGDDPRFTARQRKPGARRSAPVQLSSLHANPETSTGALVAEPVSIGGISYRDGLRGNFGLRFAPPGFIGGDFVSYPLTAPFSRFQASMAIIDRQYVDPAAAPIDRYDGPLDDVVVAVSVSYDVFRPPVTWNVRQGDLIEIDLDVRGAKYLKVSWHQAVGPPSASVGAWALVDARLLP